MKLLIQNYSNSCSSQPMYLNESMSKIGVDSKIWNINEPISVYDKLDTEKPNVVITSFQTIQEDLISYLTNNDKIQLVIDISGIDQDIFNNLSQLVTNKKIDCPFFYLFSVSEPQIEMGGGGMVFRAIRLKRGYVWSALTTSTTMS